MYITITRVKMTAPEITEEFLARNLGAQYDYQLIFSNMQGPPVVPPVPTGAKILAVVSLAFASVIAVFAF